MTYKTIVIDNVAKAKKMAAAVEKKANGMAQNGWELVTFSVTTSAKAILVFRMQGSIQDELPLCSEKETVCQNEVDEITGEAE